MMRSPKAHQLTTFSDGQYHIHDLNAEIPVIEAGAKRLFDKIISGSDPPRLLPSVSEAPLPDRSRHLYANGRAALAHACADYVMHMSGALWNMMVEEERGGLRFRFFSPQKRDYDSPHFIGAYRRFPEYVIFGWDRSGQVTAIEQVGPRLPTVMGAVGSGHVTSIVGVSVPRENLAPSFSGSDTMTAIAAAAAAQNMRKERVCTNCSSPIRPLPGIDLAVVESILGCQNCGALS